MDGERYMKFGKSIITKGIIIILLMIVLMALYSQILENKKVKTEEEIVVEKTRILLEKVEKNNYALMDKYTIYGNHLNIGGCINTENIEKINLNDLKLVIIDLEKNEYEYDLEYEILDNKIIFNLSNNINEGIDLEKISIGNYYIFVKLNGTFNNNDITKYYSIQNNTDYSSNKYYTMTKEGSNKKIDINFSSLDEINYMKISSENATLPINVYDIVIDAGHGGTDPGAMYKNNIEAEYTLDYSYELKRTLENLGYKVKLTRDKDEYVEPYGKNGRAIVPYETQSKLFLSIHLNSTSTDNPEGGVEIYCSNNMNLDFAKGFADNIVEIAHTKFSPNNESKVLEGVYVKTYSQEDVEDAIEYANELGYKPYETLSTQTPYYFMIRETGGIMTHAYIDGRNTKIGDNPYYNSNIAAESYLLELGFINSESDLENLQKNKEAYINAIVKTIVDNYNK